MNHEFDLSKFTEAHQLSYGTALEEIKGGAKYSHWMWYIFPQARGLGTSATSEYYGIRSLEEAKAFLADPYLGRNLREICDVLLELDCDNATAIFGWPDDRKLRSSMTLFACAAGGDSVFHRVLVKFFGGRYDGRTKKILNLE